MKTGRPTPPRDLDPVAKEAWRSLCDDLEEQGTLVKTDRKLIELYATTYALWDKTYKQLATQELSMGTEDRKFINPLANLFNVLSTKLHRILLDCGLSPTTRKGQPTGEQDRGDFGDGHI
jgi:P27 family predicted phage terminase small subunit